MERRRIVRRIFSIILIFLFLLVGCKNVNYINTKDDIADGDEAIIKEFRSHHGYSNSELKNLNIKYLGTVDGYKIYYVPYKVDNGFGGNNTIKEGYAFPPEAITRILGIKAKKLYTIGNLIHETQINIKNLHEVLPEEFKVK